jgi:hypothetical protein
MKRLHCCILVFCTYSGVITAAEVALAEPLGRYQCNLFGTISQEPVGDREGHSLTSFEYSCVGVEGFLKGAVATTVAVIEWDGPRGTLVTTVKIHRAPGGIAVGQTTEGTASTVMKDGKIVGTEASGTSVIRFASGTLARLSGKSLKWVSKPIGPSRFEQEYSD